MIATLVFAFPWALASLLALPGLWWLLKAVPPPPKHLVFPPVRLLMGLKSETETPNHMPLWLLILRLVLLTALILAASGPVLYPEDQSAQTTGPILIAFDDDWSTASDWESRRHWIEDRLSVANRLGRSVYLVPTARPIPTSFGPFSADQATTLIHGWQPKPWAVDRAEVLKSLQDIPSTMGLESVWLSNGLDDGKSAAFFQALAQLGNGPSVVLGRTGRVIKGTSEMGDLSFEVNSLGSAVSTLVALDDGGHEIGRAVADTSPAHLVLPVQLRNQVSRVVIEGEHSAAATLLIDEQSRRRTVALVEGASQEQTQPLLDSMTYVAKALMPFAEIKHGTLSELVADKPSVLVVASSISTDDSLTVQNWIEQGGMVIRFASTTLAQNADEPLLPTRLRAGGRELGGVLSWTEPQSLSPFAADGPFAELIIPPETEVRSQVLAEPDLAPGTKVWARLADGTPLVTAKGLGRGWLVLFHCAATPQWSTLPLSGLFPEMLHQLVKMSASSTPLSAGPFNPVRVLDGFGVLRTASADVAAITAQTVPGPFHPPGFYGDPAAPLAFNLGPNLAPLRALVPPSTVRVSRLTDLRAELDLRSGLLVLALILGGADLLLTSRLIRVVILLSVGLCATAKAAETWDTGLETRLAYVITGDSTLDRKSLAGLQALTKVLATRSTAALAEPKGVALDSDALAFYPLLYWPITAGTETLSDAASIAIKRYLKRGGLVVFDRQDGGSADVSMNAVLRRLNHVLDLPPLQQVGTDHVLNRSFYLIHSMPGRYTGAPVWVQADTADNDGVSTVILGSNDWAGEWAGQGDVAQLEAAYRFGVNLCIYALTGNYKADQVHMPAILERLGHQP